MIEINWKPTRKELRIFSALLPIFFALVAVVVYRRTSSATAAIIIVFIATVMGCVGFIWPRAIRPVYLAWMLASFPIGWTVSHLVLATIYYLLFTPIAFMLKLAGRDAMKRKFNSDSKSYWEPKTTPREPRSYFRQY